MKRLLVNCNVCKPHNCTIRTDVAVIIDVEDNETDLAYPLMKKLLALNYEVLDRIDLFKETTRFTSQLF